MLTELPNDLILRVCEAVYERQDKASLCLAVPTIGLAALRNLPAYKDPLVSVALALCRRCASELVDEALLVRRVVRLHLLRW